MYEGLIKQLRYCANSELICEETSSCPYYDKAEEETHFYHCVERMIEQAADAIEELIADRDRYKRHSDSISQLPDCNTCGKKAKGNCEFMPRCGDWVRINCAFWTPEQPKEEK